MAVSAVKRIIKRLKNGEITALDVPDEYKNNADIAIFERKAGLRITRKRGFDIISDKFFVEEELCYRDRSGDERTKEITTSFDDFDSYFTFLNLIDLLAGFF